MPDGRKVQYLIELMPDTKQFEKIRQKIKAIDGGEFIKFEPAEVKKLKGILQGVVDDVGSRASSIGTKIQQGIANGLDKDKLQKMLDIDTTKLRETMEIVEKLTGLIDDHSKGSSWLKDGKGFLSKLSGSQQDLRNLEQSIGQLELKFEGLDASLTNTIAKFDALATAIRSLQENGKPITVSPINITTDIKGVQQFEKEISDLNTLLTEISDKDIKINTSNVAKDFQKLAREADKLSEKIDDLTYEADAPGLSGDAERVIRIQIAQKKAQLAQMYREMDAMNQHYQKTHSDVTLSLFDDEGVFENPKDIVKQAKDYIESVIRELSTATKKETTKSDNVLGVEVALPSVDDIKKKLNSVIDQLNKPNSLHKVKLEVDDSVVPVEGRLDKASDAIEKKLTGEGGILAKTKNWRTEMLKQFKFKSGDFEFQFNNTLIEELQSLFDEYGLKINIDPTYLADQIKTVLEGSNIALSGGTASIDRESMTAAVMEGVRAALLGESLPMASATTSAQEKIPDTTEQVVTEIEQVAKHLDAAEEYVQDVVKKIKAVAKYAVKPADKDTAGTKATRNQFKLWGIDLEKVLGATDDSQITTMIEQSLLKRGDFNKLFGSTVIDELSSFKGSSSNTIPAFVDSLREMFFMLQEDTETVDEWTRKKYSREVFDYARGRATAADSLRNVRSSIRTDKIPDIEYIDKAIAAMSAIGKNTDSLTALKLAREKLGSNTDEQSLQEFNVATQEFYKTTTSVFYDLKKQAEDSFKGTVYLQGSKKGIVKKQNIESYKQLARIGDEDVILDIRVTSSLNNVALGTTKSKHKNRISPHEEQRLLDGKRGDYTVSPEYERDILKRELEYGGFKPQGVESAELNIEASIENLKKRIFETAEIIPELQKQITALDEEVETKRREMKDARAFLETVQNNPNATDAEKLNAKYADVDAHDAFAQALNKQKALREQINSLEASQDRTKNTIQQLELTKQHNELLAKSLELEGSIIKAEKDGAPQKELQERKQELEGIREQLTEIVSKATELGGLYQGVASREYSAAERKTYALEQIKQIDNDLITARAQKNVVASRIAKKDKEIAEVDRWGLGAGIGKRALNEEQYKATSEFMNSNYVRSLIDTAREQTKNAIAEAVGKSEAAETEALRVFNEKVANAMIKDNLNPQSAEQTKAFLQTTRGKQYSEDYNTEIESIQNSLQKSTRELWSAYDDQVKEIRSQVLAEFKENIKVDNGVLKYVTKIQDESGEWINEIVEVHVRDALLKSLNDAKEILEEEQAPMQSNIDRLYADRKAAIEYGGVGEKEILSADVIEDQIRREEDLAEKQAKRAESLQKISDLEQAGVADSDESIKQEKRKLAETEKQISRLEMLIRNRQKLVELRWDESKTDSYTDEEKELHFTEQVVNYNQKIENSLARQEELKKKIATASEAEKTQLQYALKQEEDKVVGWRGKISGFEGQLQNVRTAKSEVAATNTGESSGGLIAAIKEAIGTANIDLTPVTEILNKILEVLNGSGVVLDQKTKKTEANVAKKRAVKTGRSQDGQTVTAYHGTRNGGFAEFDLSKSRRGHAIFLSDNKTVAATYAGGKDNDIDLSSGQMNQKGVYTVNVTADKVLTVDAHGAAWSQLGKNGTINGEPLVSGANKIGYKLSATRNPETSEIRYDKSSFIGIDDDSLPKLSLEGTAEQITKRMLDAGYTQEIVDLILYRSEQDIRANLDKLKQGQAVETKPRRGIIGFNKELQRLAQETTDDIVEQAFASGFDRVDFKNIRDIGPGLGKKPSGLPLSTVYAVKNASQAQIVNSTPTSNEYVSRLQEILGGVSGDTKGTERSLSAVYDKLKQSNNKAGLKPFEELRAELLKLQSGKGSIEEATKKARAFVEVFANYKNNRFADMGKWFGKDVQADATSLLGVVKQIFGVTSDEQVARKANRKGTVAKSVAPVVDDTNETTAGGLGSLAKEETLSKILEVLNKISTNGISKGSTKSSESKKDEDPETPKNDELEKLAKKSGVSDVRAAFKQHGTLEARGILDIDDLEAVRNYKAEYEDLIAKHKEFDTAGTLYDPTNQKTLQNMAIRTRDLGKALEKSVGEAEQLQQLVDNSGTFNGKKLGGMTHISPEETQNLEASMRSYLQTLGVGNVEHVKFDHIHQKLTGTVRTSNKTVADLEVKYNDVTSALYAYQKAERESLTGVPAFLNGFKKKFNSIMQYLTMTMSIHQVMAQLRRGVQYVKEIDLALTELRKVTDETKETYDEFLKTAAKTGARLGTTISAVTEATATFAKLGYTMEQATEMAEAAIVYKNVGDNIASTSDAADSIISTMKGFKLEATEAMRIVDRFNEVGNRFAITSQGIGEALRLSASALSEGGNSLDESIGLITAANEVVNDPSSVGTALKTLTLRLRGSKTE